MQDKYALEETKLSKFTGQSGKGTGGEWHEEKLKGISGSEGEK